MLAPLLSLRRTLPGTYVQICAVATLANAASVAKCIMAEAMRLSRGFPWTLQDARSG